MKKAEQSRNDAFVLCCWRRLSRVPWMTRRANQSILKEIKPEYLLENLWWSQRSNTLATSREELTHLKSPWCWQILRPWGEGDNRGQDDWKTSPTQWTRVWASSGRWWRTGKQGVLQFMGPQRVGHDWATEMQWYYICLPYKKA